MPSTCSSNGAVHVIRHAPKGEGGNESVIVHEKRIGKSVT